MNNYAVFFALCFSSLGLLSIFLGILTIIKPKIWWRSDRFFLRITGITAKPNEGYALWQRIIGVFAVFFGLFFFLVALLGTIYLANL